MCVFPSDFLLQRLNWTPLQLFQFQAGRVIGLSRKATILVVRVGTFLALVNRWGKNENGVAWAVNIEG